MCRIILQCFIVYIYCLFVYGWFTEAVKLLKKHQNACSKTIRAVRGSIFANSYCVKC